MELGVNVLTNREAEPTLYSLMEYIVILDLWEINHLVSKKIILYSVNLVDMDMFLGCRLLW